MDTKTLVARAEKCVKTNNYQLAQKIYQQVLDIDPQDLESRKNLRAVSLKLLDNNNGKVPTLKATKLSLQIGMAGKNYSKTLTLTEQLLGFDPKNAKMLIKQGISCLELDYLDTAVYCFDSALTIEPKNTEALKFLTKVYEEKGGRENLRQAVQYAQKLKESDPKNKEFVDLAKNIDAKLAALPFENNLEEGIKDKDETMAREKEEQMLHTEDDAKIAIKRLKEKAILDSKNPLVFEKLGEAYLKIKDATNAKEAFSKALEINPANVNMLVRIGDISINEINWKLQELNQALEKAPESNEIINKIKELKEQRHKVSLVEFEKRVDSQPTNNTFKFELGKLYFVEGRDNDAIRLFQITSHEPKFRTDSLIFLGKLFSRKEDFDLAVSQFDESIKAMVGFDVKKKDTLYHKAHALEQLGRLEDAKATFQSILVEDIGYKDVSNRVDTLKQKLK